MSRALLTFKMAEEYGGPKILEVEIRAGFDGTVKPLSLSVTEQAADGRGVAWELNLDFTSEQVRALRAFCDVALAFPYDDSDPPESST
ncbi:hypothetical protein UFOVP1302_47 [uncultured Caudovirales phage]|uniref:Uncharacterized protein n=1 Tax=uncultured Caudovirales phage TaxID=2100421 RepID=A0A6J5QGE4_9CAUD|nr:hypothetical protein UFOVP895_50 [uncultured Caudovirales phage]CAB4181437.1 hypothetical protein UFOVP1070_37 [uncultured Caudovirales phage]CAB4195985.1 hypothetical protein UFOVP1302_47 [uncultured Caudovirales phage]CAB4211913.1 hypothetical protein UFOVP1416_65 [uncultured Caudovirales phage]